MRQLRSTLAVRASSHRIVAATGVVGGVAGVEAERAGQEVDAEVQPDAGGEQVLDLLVGLVLPDRGVEVDRHQVRGAQAEAPGQLADDHLGDEDLQPLPGAAELADVGAEVVGLDDAGQRAALAQGRDVAGRGDGGDHGVRLPVGRRHLAGQPAPLVRDVEVRARPARVHRRERLAQDRRRRPGRGTTCGRWGRRARARPRCCGARARPRRRPGRPPHRCRSSTSPGLNFHCLVGSSSRARSRSFCSSARDVQHALHQRRGRRRPGAARRR